MGTGLAIAVACGGLAGCVSTQQKNERAKLVATRELASRKPQRVTRRDPRVRVIDAALVRGRRASAIVVVLRNRSTQSLTDVPLAVGVREHGGRRLPLNDRRGLDWFQTHVPAIPAHGRATWVFTTHRAVPAGARPFAVAGVSADAAGSHAGALPRIDAVTLGASGSRRKRAAAVRVAVDNGSGIPQVGLQVYAVVRDGRRYVAAGKVAIRHLGTGARTTASVRLLGSVHGRSARVHALPTIFE